jgi:hypothetical protein
MSDRDSSMQQFWANVEQIRSILDQRQQVDSPARASLTLIVGGAADRAGAERGGGDVA